MQTPKSIMDSSEDMDGPNPLVCLYKNLLQSSINKLIKKVVTKPELQIIASEMVKKILNLAQPVVTGIIGHLKSIVEEGSDHMEMLVLVTLAKNCEIFFTHEGSIGSTRFKTESDYQEFVELMKEPSREKIYRSVIEESNYEGSTAQGIADEATSACQLFDAMFFCFMRELVDLFIGKNLQIFSLYHGNGVAFFAILKMLYLTGLRVGEIRINDSIIYCLSKKFPAPATIFHCPIDELSEDKLKFSPDESAISLYIFGDANPHPVSDGHDLRALWKIIRFGSQSASARCFMLLWGELGAGSFSGYILPFLVNHPYIKIWKHKYAFQQIDPCRTRSYMLAEVMKEGSYPSLICGSDFSQLMVPHEENQSCIDRTNPYELPQISKHVKSTPDNLEAALLEIYISGKKCMEEGNCKGDAKCTCEDKYSRCIREGDPHTMDAFEKLLEFHSSCVHQLEVIRLCTNCGGLGKCLICSKCKIAHYCSKECQRVHWSTHRRQCKQKK